MSVCVWYLCVCRGLKYFKVVSDWLTLVVDLYVILAVVFNALLSRSIGFQIFGNLKDIPLI